MPQFSIRILPGFEQQIRRVSMPNAARKVVQRAFELSFNKAYNILIDEAVENSQLMDELESGVIAAIFGMTATQKSQQIEKLRQLFRKKSIVRTGGIGGDFTSTISINNSEISKLRVSGSDKRNANVEFKWLQILLRGLEGDEINAKIADLIGVEEFVPSSSIFKKDIPTNVIEQHSRSLEAIMVTPESAAKGKNKGFKLSDRTLEVAIGKLGNFSFKIIPHPFLLNDIFESIDDKLGTLIRADFARRLKNIPPIKA